MREAYKVDNESWSNRSHLLGEKSAYCGAVVQIRAIQMTEIEHSKKEFSLSIANLN